MNTTKLSDIARELGLSVSTVSRALSGNGRVSAQTRRAIQEAVRRAGYRPNAVARSLRLKDARTIGIVVPDIANSFYAAVIKGVQRVCRDAGYTLMVSNSDENAEQESQALKGMLEKQVSGLILATVGEASGPLEDCFRSGIPVVFIDNLPASVEAFDSVSIDNHRAAFELTRELIARGHERLGIITGPLNQSTGRTRYTGFEAALGEAGLCVARDWVIEGDFKFASGHEGMRRILSMEGRPSAMVVCNNFMAYGAMKALRQAGLHVPRDMALAAFDAEDQTGLIEPVISSINQPAGEIGSRAAGMIVLRLQDGGPGGNVELEPAILEGQSW